MAGPAGSGGRKVVYIHIRRAFGPERDRSKMSFDLVSSTPFIPQRTLGPRHLSVRSLRALLEDPQGPF